MTVLQTKACYSSRLFQRYVEMCGYAGEMHAQCSTFVYLCDPRVPVVSLSRHVGDVPHAPQHLEGMKSKGEEEGMQRMRRALAARQ